MDIDPKTLTRKQIIEAIHVHCQAMGSRPYYYADEVARYDANPACIRVFRDREDAPLRAYTRETPR